MKIALASVPVVNKDIQRNMDAIIKTMEQCSGEADMIVFGESVLQGFDCLTWNYETDCSMAVSQDAPQIIQICEMANRCGIAVSFGYIEKVGDLLYSSQIVIDDTGRMLHNFHRVSVGWKEPIADHHYVEGDHFEAFSYRGKTFAIGLCGDLWTEGRPEEMRGLNADIVLWPVWCDYNAAEWNERIKHEYAEQAALCGNCVLLVNPFCADQNATDVAAGGAVRFEKGSIAEEISAGRSGIMLIEI